MDLLPALRDFAGLPTSSDTKAMELLPERDVAVNITGAPGSSASRFAQGTALAQLRAYASGGHEAIDWVADCLEVICETASSAPWHFEDARGERLCRNDADRQEKGERSAPALLVQLLERPNPYMSYDLLLETSWIDWLLTGDGFILKYGLGSISKQPLQLYRLNPALVEVVPSEKESGPMIAGYLYHKPGRGTPIKIQPEEMIHMRRPNPNEADPYRGAGLISAGPRVFDMEVALQETKTAYFEQGARLGGVLETEGHVSDSLIQKIQRQFLGQFGGAAASYQVPVLQRGLKFNAVQNNAAEAEFVALTEQSRDRILAKFRVPKSKLGLSVETSSTTAPAEERRTFANDRMRPAMDKFQGIITRELVEPGWGLSFVIDYEYEMPIEDRIKLAGEFAKLPGVMVHEVRKFAKLDPLEGDNAKYNDEVLNLPGDNENDSEIKDQPLPGEAGRPPLPENTASFASADHPDAQTA